MLCYGLDSSGFGKGPEASYCQNNHNSSGKKKSKAIPVTGHGSL
jgi:hypothetical protein